MSAEYTAREERFLALVAGCGSFFVRRQYDVFAGVAPGGPSGRLIAHGLKLRHIRRLDTGRRDRVYQWLGTDGETRKVARPAAIIRSLIALDFVLERLEKCQFFLSDEAKTTFVASSGRVHVPLKIEWGIDPVFTVDGCVASFCCIGHARAFGTWLEERMGVISALSRVEIVYLGTSPKRTAVAEYCVSGLAKLMNDREKTARFRWLNERWKAMGAAGFSDEELCDYRQLLMEFSTITQRGGSVNGEGVELTFSAPKLPLSNHYLSFFAPGSTAGLQRGASRLNSQIVRQRFGNDVEAES